jgi:fucose 4-O-acetylase-like acetyltransferase
VDRLFLLRLHLSCLIGAFYFFRLMFPETGIYDQAGLDPERAAGIVYARALWVPFWFLMLLATWKQRRGEQTTFWAYAIVTTLNLFFDIPYFFFSSPYGFNSQAFFALSARLLVVALAWSMVRNLPYLPLERRFFTLPIAPRGSLPSAPPKHPNAVN